MPAVCGADADGSLPGPLVIAGARRAREVVDQIADLEHVLHELRLALHLARRPNQRPRDRHALTHPSRQLARIFRGVTLDVEADLGDPLARPFAPFTSG